MIVEQLYEHWPVVLTPILTLRADIPADVVSLRPGQLIPCRNPATAVFERITLRPQWPAVVGMIEAQETWR